MFEEEKDPRIDEIAKCLEGVYPDGLDFCELLKRVKTVEDSRDMSRLLFAAHKTGMIVKQNHKYFFCPNHPDRKPVHVPTRAEASVSRAVRPEYFNPVHSRTVKPSAVGEVIMQYAGSKQHNNADTLPMGKLSRDGHCGSREDSLAKLALAAYTFRTKGSLTTQTLAQITGLGVVSARTHLNTLAEMGYVLKIKTSEKNSNAFRWSHEFEYPFPTIATCDHLLLKFRTERELNLGIPGGDDNRMIIVKVTRESLRAPRQVEMNRKQAINWYEQQIAATREELARLESEYQSLIKD